MFLILFPSVTNAFPIGRVGSSIVLSCCPDTVRRNLHPDQAPDLEAHGHELIKRYLQQQKDAAAAASSTSSLLLVNPKQPVRTTRAGDGYDVSGLRREERLVDVPRRIPKMHSIPVRMELLCDLRTARQAEKRFHQETGKQLSDRK